MRRPAPAALALVAFGLVLVVRGAPVLRGQQPRALTADDIVAFKSVASIAVAPDRRSAVASLRSANLDQHRFETDLWLVPLDGKPPRQLTFAAGSEESPAWAPDGSRVAFIARRDDTTDVRVLPLAGGDAKPFAAVRGPVSSFTWSPDGKHLALIGPPEDTEQERRRRSERDDAYVAGTEWRNHRVWIAAEDGVPRPVTDGRRHVRLARWSPDGRQIAVITTPTPEADSTEDARVEVVELDTGRTREVPDSSQASDVAWSPNGGVLLVVRPYDGHGISREDAFIWALGGARAVNVTRQLDRDVQRVFWREGSRIDVLYAEGTANAVSAIDAQSGSVTSTWSPGLAISEIAPAGESWVFVGGDRPDELQLATGDDTRTLTAWNAPLAAALQLPVSETVRWRSAAGPIEGVLIRPAEMPQGRRLPVIVNPHGGPRGRSSMQFDPQAAFFVSQGFLVLKPNFRGSTGYGDLFTRANVANWGDGPMRDVLAGVESLALRGTIDPARMFIYGWSYGGYLVNWTVAHSEQFRAAASGAGVADLRMQYAISDARRWRFDYFAGTPFIPENLPLYERESPITYARSAKTPTLFLHGERDVRCPPEQGWMMHRALQDSGVDSQMVLYPREGHGFVEPRHIVDRARRIVEWFRAHDPGEKPQRRGTR